MTVPPANPPEEPRSAAARAWLHLTRLESAGWVERPGPRRSLRVTDSGAVILHRVLGVALAA